MLQKYSIHPHSKDYKSSQKIKLPQTRGRFRYVPHGPPSTFNQFLLILNVYDLKRLRKQYVAFYHEVLKQFMLYCFQQELSAEEKIRSYGFLYNKSETVQKLGSPLDFPQVFSSLLECQTDSPTLSMLRLRLLGSISSYLGKHELSNDFFLEALARARKVQSKEEEVMTLCAWRSHTGAGVV